jgi:glycosyltransferase involved in cell wall biosynthesis
MNDQTKLKLTGETIDPASIPGLMGGERASDARELLEQLTLQNRRIAALERMLSAAGSGRNPPGIVTLKGRMPRQPKLAEAPLRQYRRSPPWWPERAEPPFALTPPPGAQCLTLDAKTAKVLAFAVFGLHGDALEREVERVAREQIQQGNFIPVFLTDARDHEPFRRRRYLFEYFPRTGDTIDLDQIQPRLEAIEAKWGVDLFINLGRPNGAWIRRETRSPAERYALARTQLLAGRYADAKRLMTGFTAALNQAAAFRTFGRRAASPKATIVVVSHVDHAGVERGLDSIARQIDLSETEVILVDNGNGRLAEHGKRLFRHFGLAEPGFNAGCSAARNLGAHHAAAPYVIFLDDDGITAAGAVDALLRCITETRAVAVRGRVLPVTSPELKGTHYDLGQARVPALNTTEGVSIWSRDVFNEAGGFDPLLAGHEGAELCSRLWRFHGPSAFLYEPDALLYHDYAPSGSASEAKNRRYLANAGYLDSLGVRWKEINSCQLRFVNDTMLGYLATRKPPPVPGAARQSLSVITTAKNARHFLAEYTRSLKSQTDGDFEVIFVDDHSEDGTAEEIAALWAGDDRLKLFKTVGKGRGAALNTATRNATGDLCMIMDVDDLSVPERVELTRNFFSGNPDMECMSFVAFNEKNPFRLGPPRSIFVDDVAVRQLFGMPVSFPAFAYRRNRFAVPFNEEIAGGIDCDWLFRRIEAEQIRGKIVFFPAVYYREHEGQITSTRKDTQLAIRKQAIANAYARVLGPLSDEDHAMIQLIGDTKKATSAVKAQLTRWAASFLQANRAKRVFEPGLLDQAMFEALRDVAVIPG